MGRALGVWFAVLACACLLVVGCAENALVTPTASPSSSTGTSGTTGGSADAGASEEPSSTPSERPTGGVIDESAGRYPDGLPKVVDGQPVLRGDAAVAHAAATNDSSPFLVAGWVTPDVPGPSTQPCPSSGCGDLTRFSDIAGTVDGALDKQIDFRLLSSVSTLVGGPIVLQVHTHDPQPDCTAASCDSVMIPDAVVWAGDAETEAGPFSLDATTSIIGDTFKNTTFQAMGSPIVDCGRQLPASQLLVAEPPADETGASAPRDWVASVNVAPTVDALGAALKAVALPKTPAARPGVDNVFMRSNLLCRATPGGLSHSYRWFIVDNVAMLLATSPGSSLDDRVFIQELATAFDKATNGSPGASESPVAGQSLAPSPSAPVSSPPSPHATPKATRKH